MKVKKIEDIIESLNQAHLSALLRGRDEVKRREELLTYLKKINEKKLSDQLKVAYLFQILLYFKLLIKCLYQSEQYWFSTEFEKAIFKAYQETYQLLPKLEQKKYLYLFKLRKYQYLYLIPEIFTHLLKHFEKILEESKITVNKENLEAFKLKFQIFCNQSFVFSLLGELSGEQPEAINFNYEVLLKKDELEKLQKNLNAQNNNGFKVDQFKKFLINIVPKTIENPSVGDIHKNVTEAFLLLKETIQTEPILAEIQELNPIYQDIQFILKQLESYIDKKDSFFSLLYRSAKRIDDSQKIRNEFFKMTIKDQKLKQELIHDINPAVEYLNRQFKKIMEEDNKRRLFFKFMRPQSALNKILNNSVQRLEVYQVKK